MLGLLGASPRYAAFYDLFERAGANADRACRLLARLMREWPDDGNALRLELKELESEGDRITHDLIHHLNVKAATPFAVSHAHALITEIDDVVDLAEEAADFMGLYRVEAATEQAIELSAILAEAGTHLGAALALLRDPPKLRQHVVALYRLEHEGDRVQRAALSSLFGAGIDPMVVVRWKDIYHRLEAAIDACRHVANKLESLIVASA